MRNAVLSSKVEGSTAIIFIVPEGTAVKTGELVCELDSSVLADKETAQEILAARAKTAYEQGLEDLKIQEIQNTSEIEAAALKLQLAEIDLAKFEKGDLIQQKDELENQLKLADQNLSRATESLEYVKRLAKSGYRTQNDLEAELIAVEGQRINKKLIEGKKKVLLDYTEERTLVELKAKVDECKREIERTESRTKSAMSQKEAELFARKLSYEVEQHKHERLVAQIAACKIYATQDGQVVYANTRDGRSQDQVMIDVGVLVRERQAIINLPDLDSMKVNARIHESRISMVRQGMSATIKVDAHSDETFHGRVDSVANVPSSTGGYSSSVKEYEAVIRIIDETEKVNKLRPGMTANTEILVERREDVLQIPVIASVTVGSKQFAFVVKDNQIERRDIKVGKTNSNFVEILDGVAEGEEVVMNPRSHFGKDITEIENQMANEPKETTAPPVESPSDKAMPDTLAAKMPGADSAGGGPEGRRRPRGGEGQQQGAEAGPGGGSGNFDPMARFNQMDKDQDGKVTKTEAEGRFAENFDSFDSDADGSVTKDEFLAARARFGGGRGGGGRPRTAEAGGN